MIEQPEITSFPNAIQALIEAITSLTEALQTLTQTVREEAAQTRQAMEKQTVLLAQAITELKPPPPERIPPITV